MKRNVINILLSLLILFSNSGWAITFHYCKDALSSVSLEYTAALADEEDDTCNTTSCCGDDEEEDTSHKKCCDDTSVSSSIADSTDVVKVLQLQLYPFVAQPTTLPLLGEIVEVREATKSGIVADFLDRLNAPPLYELYCQRVFYLGKR